MYKIFYCGQMCQHLCLRFKKEALRSECLFVWFKKICVFTLPVRYLSGPCFGHG